MLSTEQPLACISPRHGHGSIWNSLRPSNAKWNVRVCAGFDQRTSSETVVWYILQTSFSSCVEWAEYLAVERSDMDNIRAQFFTDQVVDEDERNTGTSEPKQLSLLTCLLCLRKRLEHFQIQLPSVTAMTYVSTVSVHSPMDLMLFQSQELATPSISNIRV